jgi:hypothetical protein
MTMVVKNLCGESANVTWGKETKVFTKTDLEKGINLAAEFIDNPFSPSFLKVDSAIGAKQNFQTFMIKGQINSYPNFLTMMPNDEEVKTIVTSMTKKLWEKDEAMDTAAKALVTSVKHTITIAVLK